jgi:hypothetical protein
MKMMMMRRRSKKCTYFDFSIKSATISDLSFYNSPLLHFLRRPQCPNVLISVPVQG